MAPNHVPLGFSLVRLISGHHSLQHHPCEGALAWCVSWSPVHGAGLRVKLGLLIFIICFVVCTAPAQQGSTLLLLPYQFKSDHTGRKLGCNGAYQCVATTQAVEMPLALLASAPLAPL